MPNPPVQVPEDYVNPGLATLDLEFPWIVPESAQVLNQYVDLKHQVLDLGSGGSTFFYARRCQHVHAVETIQDYSNLVRDRIVEKHLQHKIDYFYMTNPEVVKHISSLPDRAFDIVSVDTMTGISRTSLFETMLPKWRGGIIVMDNWANKRLWPELYRLSGIELLDRYDLTGYEVRDFTDPNWKGSGTRLIINHALQQ